MLNTYEQLKPNYSLADLFNDIRKGNKKEYQYNEKTYNVIQTFPKWIIKDESGNTATAPYFNCMLDLQGTAACLQEYKRDLIFNRNGDIIN